jgi:hypothetical protein
MAPTNDTLPPRVYDDVDDAAYVIPARPVAPVAPVAPSELALTDQVLARLLVAHRPEGVVVWLRTWLVASPADRGQMLVTLSRRRLDAHRSGAAPG